MAKSILLLAAILAATTQVLAQQTDVYDSPVAQPLGTIRGAQFTALGDWETDGFRLRVFGENLTGFSMTLVDPYWFDAVDNAPGTDVLMTSISPDTVNGGLWSDQLDVEFAIYATPSDEILGDIDIDYYNINVLYGLDETLAGAHVEFRFEGGEKVEADLPSTLDGGFTVVVVPEPSTILMLVGFLPFLAVLVFVRLRRKMAFAPVPVKNR